MRYALDLPWGYRHPKVQYWKQDKVHVFTGPILPPELRPFASKDFSYTRWKEDEYNGMVQTPHKTGVNFSLRDYQAEASKKILKSYRDGFSGFLLADKTGLGKAVASSTEISTPNGFTTMGELKVGDQVLSRDGSTVNVIEKTESRSTSFYRLKFSDGTRVDCDEEHRWLVKIDDIVRKRCLKKNSAISLSKEGVSSLTSFLNDAAVQRKAVTLDEILSHSHEEIPDVLTTSIRKIRPVGVVMSQGEGKYVYHPQIVSEWLYRTNVIPHDHSGPYLVLNTSEIVSMIDGGNAPTFAAAVVNGERKESVWVDDYEKIEKTERYYCISVDGEDHTYLITKNRIPTHNTLSGLSGVTLLEKENGFGEKNKAKVLIVCPKSAIPQWRNTIYSYPVSTVMSRFLIINYEQLTKLLSTPSSGRAAKKASTKRRQTARGGKPLINWDYVIFDESHKLKNMSAMTTRAAINVAELDSKYVQGKSPFVVFSTATPGATPLNFAVMSGIMGPLLDKDKGQGVTPKRWGDFLNAIGFHVTKGNEWTWVRLPSIPKKAQSRVDRAKFQAEYNAAVKMQRQDSQRIGKALLSENAPFIMRSPKDIAGWPEQQLVPYPIEMTPDQLPVYEELWSRFRRWLNLSPARKDPKGALVENLRYRQKSSLLKVPAVIDFTVDQVDQGNQVYISAEFMETLDGIAEGLNSRGIPWVEISGRTTDQREKNRLSFQRGEAKVVLSTVLEAVSYHANETLPDGTKATSAPRVTVVVDVRQNPLDNVQLLGRAHRDGQHSIAYFPYLVDTVDEKVIQSFTNKNANMKTMTGSGSEDAEFMDKVFRSAAAKFSERKSRRK